MTTVHALLRPSELHALQRRRAFLEALITLRTEVERQGVVWRDLSMACDYKPDTLSSVFSNSMVYKQKRFNYKALVTAMRKMRLTIPDILVPPPISG